MTVEVATNLGTVEQAAEVGAPVHHAPGIYFGLPDATYHADTALGSSDVKRLAFSPCDYWFGSRHNPDRPDDEQTPSQLFGSAVHKLVLEGRQAFTGRYAPTFHNGSTKAGKAERAEIEAAGKTAIKQDDFERIQAAGAAIAANTSFADAFSGGLSEVSVFWDDSGIRKKCRIDYLKARASVDLKSIRNTRNIAFPEACRRAISDYRYDVQAEHYRQGRAAMAALAADGAIYGDFDEAWIKNAVRTRSPAFVIVFYQAEGAPLTWGATLSPQNPILEIAAKTIAVAEENFRTFCGRFGLDRPWMLEEPLAELELAAMPAWFGRT